MAQTEPRSFKRAPADVGHVRYINSLVEKDVEARAGELATAKKFDELAKLMSIREWWAATLESLDHDEVKQPSEPPTTPAKPKPEATIKPKGGDAK